MTICDTDEQNPTTEENSDYDLHRTPNNKLHLMYQKLIIKHCRLKKLSLWGCSGLDVRFSKFIKNMTYFCKMKFIAH